MPRVIGGRYGLSSKEFTPAMVKAVFDELVATQPKNHFTVGIHDDVTHTSLDYDPAFSIERDDVVRAHVLRPGLRRHGRREQELDQDHRRETASYAQGYFVYDSKKSGAMTVSHLRFGPRPIRAHVPDPARQLRRLPPVRLHRAIRRARELAARRATFLLNSPFGPDEVWDELPRTVQDG